MEYQRAGELSFYTVTSSDPEQYALMFYEWPAPSQPREIRELLQALSDGFLMHMTNTSPQATVLNPESKIEPIMGDVCRGNYVLFRVRDGEMETIQTMFMVAVDGKLWNGQFTGTAEEWPCAWNLIRSIRPAR